MDIGNWITLVGLICGFIGGLITVWINLNVRLESDKKDIGIKMKELELKIQNNELQIQELKQDKEKIDNKIWEKLDKIDNKLDEKFELLTTLKAEHEQNKCFYYDNKK